MLTPGGDEAEEPPVVRAHAAKCDLLRRVLGQLQPVVVEQKHTVLEDEHEHRGVHLLLHSEATDAVADVQEAAAAARAVAVIPGNSNLYLNSKQKEEVLLSVQKYYNIASILYDVEHFHKLFDVQARE